MPNDDIKPKSYYVSFTIKESWLSISEHARWFINKFKWANVENLYIHDGEGNAYQQNRKCTCGSHLFGDSQKIIPISQTSQWKLQCKVKCLQCGLEYDVQ